jgi:hypothetical protein
MDLEHWYGDIFSAYERQKGEFEAEFKKALACESGAQGYCLMKKPRVENLLKLSL